MGPRQRPASTFENFLEASRTPATRANYSYGIKAVVGPEVDKFLQLAMKDPEEAEWTIISFIRDKKDKVASATIVNPVMAVKSMLEYYQIEVAWNRIRRELPVHQKVAMDRPPTVEEIRSLLLVCDLRMRAAVLILASSGIRVGAFDGMKLSHLKGLDTGAGLLTIYPKTPYQYQTFISPEALAAVKQYLAARESVGEKLKPDSPILRDKWDFEDRIREIKRSTIAPDIPTPMTSKAIKNRLNILWVKAGVRDFTRKRGEFQQAHGFRKFFKSQASKGIIRPEVVETLMGHKANYFKPSNEELEQEYLKAVPHLTISEAEQVKKELETQEKKHESEWEKTRLENLELKESMRAMKENQARVADIVAELQKRYDQNRETIRLMATYPKAAEVMKEYMTPGTARNRKLVEHYKKKHPQR